MIYSLLNMRPINIHLGSFNKFFPAGQNYVSYQGNEFIIHNVTYETKLNIQRDIEYAKKFLKWVGDYIWDYNQSNGNYNINPSIRYGFESIWDEYRLLYDLKNKIIIQNI